MNLTGHFLDQRSIQMNWTRIPKEFRHGVIFGYKLHYKDETLVDAPWKNITIANREGGGDEFNETITGLKIYTPYTFRIQAFTYKADGAMSKNVTVWTDEYGIVFHVFHVFHIFCRRCRINQFFLTIKFISIF